MVDFIGVYDRACPPDMCKKIIDFFEDNKELQVRGRYALDDEVIRDPIFESKDVKMGNISSLWNKAKNTA